MSNGVFFSTKPTYIRLHPGGARGRARARARQTQRATRPLLAPAPTLFGTSVVGEFRL